jgi:hypothetical protein
MVLCWQRWAVANPTFGSSGVYGVKCERVSCAFGDLTIIVVHSKLVLTMMVPHASAPTLEGLREASERWVRRERARSRLPSGVAALDVLLGGGWPQGKVGELAGPDSSGRSGVAAATVAAATARGEVVAWLDAADALDPVSAAAAGMNLRRVLWVRPRGVGEAVRAAELVLEVGGFTVVVLDFGDVGSKPRSSAECRLAEEPGARHFVPDHERARAPRKGSLRLRLARAVERAGAVALVLAERPWVGTLAGVTVVLGRGEVHWGEGVDGGPRWLAGIALRAQVERGGAREGTRHDRNVGTGLAPARQGRREQTALGA